MRAGVVNYCAWIDSRIFKWEGCELRKKGAKAVKMAEVGRWGEIRSTANGPGNQTAGPNFRYSTPLGIYYSVYGRGGSCVTHVHFDAITASCYSNGIRKTAGRKSGDSMKESLRAFVSLSSRGFFHVAHFDLIVAIRSCEESVPLTDVVIKFK